MTKTKRPAPQYQPAIKPAGTDVSDLVGDEPVASAVEAPVATKSKPKLYEVGQQVIGGNTYPAINPDGLRLIRVGDEVRYVPDTDAASEAAAKEMRGV